jgi:hypothetical protein
MTEDQLPDRVRAAEENREFRQLLEQSSIGQPPKGFENEPAIGSGMCETCRSDWCGEIDCLTAGCACTCIADKSALHRDMLEIYDNDNPESLYDVACSLYGRGWRREG